MEGFLIFVLLVLAVWLVRRLRRTERDVAAAQQASEKALSGLTKRMYDLENELARLRRPATQSGAVESPLTPPAPPAPAVRPPSPPPPQTAPPPYRLPAQTETPASLTPIPPAPKVEPFPAIAPPQQPGPAVSPPPLRATPAPTPPATGRTQPIAPAPARRWSDIEEILGTNWLNKIGITILVIGLGLLLNYWVPRLSAGSKVALAYALCAVLLALGVYGERSERYRKLARVILGGGWAATYGTTYALYNVEAVKLVKDPMTGFLLLFLVAAGIVAHSLRYNSQVVTGFAYLLGFVTLVLGRIEMGTMVASALLAASLVVVLWRKKWYAIEPLALAAVYGVHWLWLRQIFEQLGGKKPFPEFSSSGALLTVYWALFTISYFLRDEREPEQRRAFAATLLLNAAGFLSVMGYQALDPHLRFRFLLSVGAAYLALAVFSRRVQRRLGFLLTSTLGSALVMVALYYKFTGANLELLWVAEAQVLLFVGWRAADPHLRRLGWFAAGVVVPYVAFHHLWPRFVETRSLDAPLGWLLLAMAAIYFADARFVPRLLGNDATPMDSLAAQVAGPVGTALILAAAWVAIPFLWVAVAWAVVALLLREYGHWRKDFVLHACAYAAAVAVIARLLVVNLPFHPAPGAANLRYGTMALAVVVLYAFAWRLRAAEEPAEADNLIAEFLGSGYSALFVWAATLPVGLLIAMESSPRPLMLTWIVLGLTAVASIVSYPVALGYLMTAAWLALPFMWVALVWTSLAVVVGEIGSRRDHRVLRACGHVAAVFALLRLLVVNLQHAPVVANLSLRLLTVGLSVALFYIFARRVAGNEAEELAWRGRIAPLYSISATLLATLLIWREASNAAVALAWAMFGLALAEVARVRNDRPLRMQGYALLTLSFARIFFADLNAANELFRLGAGFMITPRLLSVSALAVIYYCAARTADDWPGMRAALDWFGTVALAALARFELPLAWVAVGWAAMTVALYFAGGRPGLQAFRLQAYLLALLVGVRCALDNFYQTGPFSGSSGVSIRTVTVVAACALLYILLGPALAQTRTARAAPQRSGSAGFRRRWAERLDRNAQHLYFFLPTLLLTVLISLEFHQRADLRSYLTAAWGLEGMLVFLIALPLGERAFRWFGLGLLLLCVGRVVTVDVWSLSGLGKIVSFMGLGAALLVVSFLYARYREKWQKYL